MVSFVCFFRIVGRFGDELAGGCFWVFFFALAADLVDGVVLLGWHVGWSTVGRWGPIYIVFVVAVGCVVRLRR